MQNIFENISCAMHLTITILLKESELLNYIVCNDQTHLLCFQLYLPTDFLFNQQIDDTELIQCVLNGDTTQLIS